MRMLGKKGVVTGAASGIGRATAIRLAGEGAVLTIADINAAGLQDTLGMMTGAHRITVYDANDITSCHNVIAEGASDGLDFLCNIGGMLDWGPSAEFSEERFAARACFLDRAQSRDACGRDRRKTGVFLQARCGTVVVSDCHVRPAEGGSCEARWPSRRRRALDGPRPRASSC